jgi:hypothetical protein
MIQSQSQKVIGGRVHSGFADCTTTGMQTAVSATGHRAIYGFERGMDTG